MKKLIAKGFFCALGEVVYVSLVAGFMRNISQIFKDVPDVVGLSIFLLLFVVSAVVSGALILGQPILLYLSGKKGEAIKLFFFILGWLVIFLLVAFFSLILSK